VWALASLGVEVSHGRNTEPVMTEVEKYAVGLVAAGALSYAEGDIDEDGHPDADFPEHTFYDDDPAFEAALAHYWEASA
jgi:hypothetical protein